MAICLKAIENVEWQRLVMEQALVWLAREGRNGCLILRVCVRCSAACAGSL